MDDTIYEAITALPVRLPSSQGNFFLHEENAESGMLQDMPKVTF